MKGVLSMTKGYAGKLLRVFLDEKKAKEELNFDDLRKYIGGVGYGAKLFMIYNNSGTSGVDKLRSCLDKQKRYDKILNR